MRTCCITTLLLSVLTSICLGQQNRTAGSELSRALQGMTSEKWTVRERSFHDLLKIASGTDADVSSQSTRPVRSLRKFIADNPSQAESVRGGLNRLLQAENALVDASDREYRAKLPGREDEVAAADSGIGGVSRLSEEYTEYYASLIEVVAGLQDEREIPALVGAIKTGATATNALIRFGQKAVDQVLGKLSDPDPLIRSAALGIAVAIFENDGTAPSRTRAADLVRLSLKDPDPTVRSSAIYSIGCLVDREKFIPELDDLAKTDPAKLPGRSLDGGDGGLFFPVRYDARQMLKQIQEHGGCQK